MLNPRGQFLSELGDLSRLRGLEIGALDNPLVERLKGGNNIFYLDHLYDCCPNASHAGLP